MRPRYINATALMDFCSNMKDRCIDNNDIARFPAADVRENVYGMWVEDDTGAAYCSHCGEYPYDDGEYRLASWKPKYCPNCGAGMVREKVRMNDEQK